jgi:two-component system, response regulator PdtaR
MSISGAQVPLKGGGKALRVLVAEDETLIRMDLVETLIERGFTITAAVANGQAAVDSAFENQPDAVLMDVSMPIRDGISAAEHIMSAGIAPVVMLSAFTEQDLVSRAASAGVFGYLVKPFRATELAPALNLAVSRWKEFVDLGAELDNLRERREASSVVERAKVILMQQGISEEQSFGLLRRWAMDRRQTISEVSAQVVAAGGSPAPQS